MLSFLGYKITIFIPIYGLFLQENTRKILKCTLTFTFFIIFVG